MTEPIIYESAGIYLATAKSLKDKIAKIDLIIDALILSAGTASTTDHITEYQLNTGQTIIKANYRGAKALSESIMAFEKMRELYLNRLHGRMIRLVDGKNF